MSPEPEGETASTGVWRAMKGIVVVGSINMDLVLEVPHLPRPGETIRAGSFKKAPGGKGANQAVAAARLGAAVTHIGQVGDDAYGEELLRGLKANGVDTRLVKVDATANTGLAMIAVDAAGENTIIVQGGANWTCSPLLVAEGLKNCRDAEAVLLQLEIPLPAVEAAVAQARANNQVVILNPAPAARLPESLLQQVDFLIPNETEAQQLSGIAGGEEALPIQAARALSARSSAQVIVTLGGKGVIWANREGEVQHFPAYQVEVVDTTAAGDAFVAGFAVALREAGSPEAITEAIRRAMAVGALTVTRPGAQPSLPTAAEVAEFLQGEAKHHGDHNSNGIES